jgi:hypothetical protein
MKFAFNGEGLLALCPIPKLEDHPLSFVRGRLFNIFAATFNLQNKDPPYCANKGTHLTTPQKLLNSLERKENRRHTCCSTLKLANIFTLYVYLSCEVRQRLQHYLGFEIFTVVNMKNGDFWDVTPCGSCKNRRFGGT